MWECGLHTKCHWGKEIYKMCHWEKKIVAQKIMQEKRDVHKRYYWGKDSDEKGNMGPNVKKEYHSTKDGDEKENMVPKVKRKKSFQRRWWWERKHGAQSFQLSDWKPGLSPTRFIAYPQLTPPPSYARPIERMRSGTTGEGLAFPNVPPFPWVS